METKSNIIGVGIDLEDVDSFREKTVDGDPRFYDRLFSQAEIEYCQRHRDPAPHFAARFCAKEALVKASRGIVNMQVTDAEVSKLENGAPEFRVRSSRTEIIRFFSEHNAHLSLTHTKALASAFVVVVSKEAKQ